MWRYRFRGQDEFGRRVTSNCLLVSLFQHRTCQRMHPIRRDKGFEMSAASIAQYLLFIVVVALLVMPAGGYMTRVFTGQPTMLDRLLVPLERQCYRWFGITPKEVMTYLPALALGPLAEHFQMLGGK